MANFPLIQFPVVRQGGEACWHQPATSAWSECARDWLLDPSSLTAKLKARSQSFQVQLLGQHEAPLLADERHWLGAAQSGIVREVILWCDEQPWVFARSVFPFSALAQQRLRLDELGDKPLGEHLFKQPDLVRSELEVSSFASTSKVGQLHQQLGFAAATLWGRRSRFTAANQHVLVAEVFIGASTLAQEQIHG
ncbi:chorismate--pyruvate lyase family protein [Pseudidiomarina insulisalsae]|uniref:Probable chorismate pyruvate-lyase n=1 Tax=Pseudidiomarina insulisalsae TaxID=575789 RepID=A0A432YPK4_9GAMM|nr:chorismate lyase [Pseudidiomarina insulisalsae]RUO63005.1 chorismate lyase [Pseudidiomarina insulisalsae]